MTFTEHLAAMTKQRTALANMLIDGRLIDNGDDHIVLAYDALDRAVQHLEQFDTDQRETFTREAQ